MGAVRVKTIADELGIDVERVIHMARLKLPAEHIKGKGLGLWIEPESVADLKEALDIPEIVPKRYIAQILVSNQAKNPVWAFGKSAELGNVKLKIAVPKRVKPRIIGKTVTIEKIEDETGSTFRYVATGR